MSEEPKRTKRRLDRADLERMAIPEEFWKVKLRIPFEGPAVDSAAPFPYAYDYLVPDSVRHTIENYLVRIDDMSEKGAGLIIGGEHGVGKTSLAVLICKQACSKGYPAFFGSVSDLMVMASENIQFNSTSSVMDRVRDVPFLVLDNLKAEDAKRPYFGSYSLDSLVAHRSSRRRVTIFTTCMGVDEFEELFPDVWEAGRSSLVYLGVEGPNLREQAQKKLEAEVLKKPEGDK